MNDTIIRQLAAVRESGAVNMFNLHGVRDVADQLGFTELTDFCDVAEASEYMGYLQEMGRRRR